MQCSAGSEGTLSRCKPFKFTYEKEIVMYAYYKKLDYFSTECVYAPNAYRGFAREFLKDAEVRTCMQLCPSAAVAAAAAATPFAARLLLSALNSLASRSW